MIPTLTWRRFLLFVAAATGIALLARAQMTGAPIMASDEYPFNVLGRFPGIDLFALDPALQRVDNRLTFALLRTWSRLEGGSGVAITRLVHVMEWLLVAGILYLAFRGVVSEAARGVGALATLLLPSAFYALTVMPETDLVFMVALLGWSLVVLVPSRPLAGSSLAGVISGVALLLKPHAMAWIPAVLLTLATAAFLERSDHRRRRRFLLATGLYLVGWYAGFLLTWRLTSGAWSLNPADALGLKFYGSIAAKAAGSGFTATNALSVAGYLLGHLVVIGLLFGPALASATAAVLRARTNGQCGPEGVAGAFVLSMLVFHLGMIAQFSASVGSNESGEAMRLHGRYLGVVLIFLPFYYFQFLEAASPRAARWAALGGLLLVVLLVVVVIPNFKIFPWDYPELFAFYRSPNHYAWNYSGTPIWMGSALLGCCLAGFVTVLAKPRWIRPVFAIQLFMVLAGGHVQVQRWLDSHLKATGDTSRIGEAIGRTLSPAAPGDGLVIGNERYGQMSYLLFGLGNAPRVMVKEAGSAILDDDVKGAKWVLTIRPYDVRFTYRTSIRFGEFVLYPLATSSPLVAVHEKVTWRGEPFLVRLGAGASPPLHGFNVQEEWGAWTSLAISEMELPFAIIGKVRLRIFGWVLPEQVGTAVQFTLGDSTRSLHMTGEGSDYQLLFDVGKSTDRLRISFPTARPTGSSRNLGVAVRDVQVEKL
jgi:hypothetical protein